MAFSLSIRAVLVLVLGVGSLVFCIGQEEKTVPDDGNPNLRISRELVDMERQFAGISVDEPLKKLEGLGDTDDYERRKPVFSWIRLSKDMALEDVSRILPLSTNPEIREGIGKAAVEKFLEKGPIEDAALWI